MKIELLSFPLDPQIVLAEAAKELFPEADLESKSAEDIVIMIKDNGKLLGRTKVLELIEFTFLIQEVSYSVVSELAQYTGVNHFRYEDLTFIIPSEIENNSVINEVFSNHMVNSLIVYNTIMRELLIENIITSKEWTEIASDEEWQSNEIYASLLSGNMVDVDKYLSVYKDKFPIKFEEIKSSATREAGYVLPLSTEASFLITINAKQFRNLISQEDITNETKLLKLEMLNFLMTVTPGLFEDLV